MLGKSHTPHYVSSFSVLPKDLKRDTYVDSSKTKMAYLYFVPNPIPPKTKVPLILFLHGGGGGNDNTHLDKFAFPLTFVQRSVQKSNPCFFVAPQCLPGEPWCEGRFDMPSHAMKMAVEIIDQFAEKYDTIDTNRLYVTGASSGGVGVWDAIAKFPGKFAAAVPVSGGWDPKMLQQKQGISVWAFYNTDEVEFVQDVCDEMLNAVIKIGGIAQKTTYPHGGHNAWSAAFAEPNLPYWLFKQQRFRPFK